MPNFVDSKCVKPIVQSGIGLKGAKVLILGVSYKADCPDVRNSKVPKLMAELVEYGLEVDVYDPLANDSEVFGEFGFHLKGISELASYQLTLCIVPHKEICKDIEIKKKTNARIHT